MTDTSRRDFLTRTTRVAIGTGVLSLARTNEAIASLSNMQEPWLLYVAYNAPHAPQLAGSSERSTSQPSPQKLSLQSA